MSETIKLVIAHPTAGSNVAGFTSSVMGLVAYVAAGKIKSRPEATLLVSQDTHESSVIHSNREALIRRAIENETTHVLFLDNDMVFEPQVLDMLLRWRQPVVAVNYVIKSWPVKDFVAVGLDGRRIATRADSTGLQEIAYSGFGVSLFETRVFKALKPPIFIPEYVPEMNTYTTEDNPCYRKIREAGFPCFIDHDASKLVSHVGLFSYRWDQWEPPARKPSSSACERDVIAQEIANGRH